MVRWLIAILSIIALPASGAETSIDTGIERNHSRAAHQALLIKAHTGRIDVYFLGDSITRRWGTSDPEYRDLLANWQENFHGWNAADFGWGSDTTWNILWRIQHGELDGVRPRIIVLLAGTNDVASFPYAGHTAAATVGSVTQGVAAIVRECRARAPGASLVLTSIPPRSDRPELRSIIERANAAIRAHARSASIRYLDLYSSLADRDGKPRPGMLASDGLHFGLDAYQVWADALRPIFLELLGPPHATDEAPPPSSDPGRH